MFNELSFRMYSASRGMKSLKSTGVFTIKEQGCYPCTMVDPDPLFHIKIHNHSICYRMRLTGKNKTLCKFI